MKQDLEDKKNQKGSADSVSVVDGEFDDNEAYADVLSVSSGKNSLIDSWVLDFACSYHMCPNRMWFDTFKSCNADTMLMGNDARCKAIGLGTIKVRMFDEIVKILTNVRYVPDLKKNLISLGTLDSLGYGYSAKDGVIKITKGAMVIMKGKKIGNLYKLLGDTVTGGVAMSTLAEPNDDNTVLWHMRLGHLGECSMFELHKRNLLKGVKSCKLGFCKYCLYGKHQRVSFKVASHTSKGVLDYVHSDVWGPVVVPSNGGAHYFFSFIDDFSIKVWVYFMKHKLEVFTIFKQWKAQVENQTGRRVKYLRSDNGLEYKDTTFLEFCKTEGITRHFTVRGTPQQNGVAERMNRTLLEKARCMRLSAELPKSFWAEAVNYACFITNRSLAAGIDFKVLEEVWSGKPVDYSMLRIFGCPTYVHVHSGERSKLDSKSRKCICLGFESGVKGYRL
jgi:hypothetical protein